MALTGIEGNVEPWIFLALGPNASGTFGPLAMDAPFAKPQMIDFRSSPGEVKPEPVVSNRPQPGGTTPTGVATNILFGNKDIPDIIANPLLSHFFNTDCLSRHTESQRRSVLGPPFGNFAFKVDGHSPARSPQVSSGTKWNVRNFGWFPDFFRNGQTVPKANQRTANETAEVLMFIEEHFDD